MRCVGKVETSEERVRQITEASESMEEMRTPSDFVLHAVIRAPHVNSRQTLHVWNLPTRTNV